ncbi:helical backbone metal receptor [Haloferax namakaokahaiae]|uniref:Helical backbone metal receptor n=1 Tax=Haloferax namakaokahaiae TaxID=1748331 RepID=A0ABD5ZHE7_9EURY
MDETDAPRVVSLAPSTTAILDAAGLDARLVGVTAHCSVERPVVGGWLNPDYDRLDALDPDVVCTCDDLQADIATELDERGYTVAHVAPATLDEVFDSFVEVCAAAGTPDAGERLAASCRDHLADIRAALTDEPTPTVYCEEWADPPMAAGNWVPDAVRAAGGSYPFLDAGVRSREVTPEAVADADPDHVVLHPCGKGERGDIEGFAAREWNLDAAVHAVDDSLLNQPSPALLAGIDHLARLFHPKADLPAPWPGIDSDEAI